MQNFTPIVQLQFTSEGDTLFAEITERMVGKPLAIFIGGELVSAPTVQAKITGGNAVITGSGEDGQTWAQDLSNNINTGIVPAPIYLSSENAIDPKLGLGALKKLIATGVG